jgi:hypothetical protein
MFKIIVLNEDLVPLVDPPGFFRLANDGALKYPTFDRIDPDKDILSNEWGQPEPDRDHIVRVTGNLVIFQPGQRAENIRKGFGHGRFNISRLFAPIPVTTAYTRTRPSMSFSIVELQMTSARGSRSYVSDVAISCVSTLFISFPPVMRTKHPPEL